MKMKFLVLLLTLVHLCRASPTVAPVPAGNDFNDLSLVESVATIAAMMSKPDGIVQPMKGTPRELLSCVDPKHLIPIEYVCLKNVENIQNLPPTSNCTLADLAGFPGNSSASFNLTAVMEDLKETTSLSSDQILAAAKTMGRCIESDFTLFQLLPEPLAQRIQTNLTATEGVTHRFGIKRKFEEHANPLRVALCAFKAIIQNGCPEVDAHEKSGSLRILTATIEEDFSGEFFEDDDDLRDEEIDDLK